MKRIENYDSDIIIEGHFHQGKSFTSNNQLYVNIPSLCCDKKYFVLNNTFEEKIL
jgi:UDP-2,3-diacylglucosamine hydrolase